jgi:hypothetical protein
MMKNILSPSVKIVITLLFASMFVATSVNAKDRGTNPLNIGFVFLTNPATQAITAQGEQSLKFADINTIFTKIAGNYKFDAAVPFQYHPHGHANAKIGIAGEWILTANAITGHFETADGILAPMKIEKPYLGSLGFNGGVETSPDNATEEWRLHNYNLSLDLYMQVPNTDIGFGQGNNLVGVVPIWFTLSGKSIFQTAEEDSTYYRLDLDVQWQLPVVGGFYLYPLWQLRWMKDTKVYQYFQGDIVKVIPGLEELLRKAKMEPIIFARYVSGQQSPEYKQINEWQGGIGIKVLF